jgi:MFS family permease
VKLRWLKTAAGEQAEWNEMAIAADSTGLAGPIEPSPSGASLRGLDEVNLLLAGALSGFGPYVAAFLAQQNWTQQNICFVLTLGGFAGLLSQLPGGALLDAVRSKRVAVALGAGMVAAGALIIAVWPSSHWYWPLWYSKGSQAASWGWRLLPSALACFAMQRAR